ncbi:MAG: TIM barrel protein [Candidatus Methanomethylophilaceae archaeon]|jgi:sugar phosphate isomerase/epimerase
MKHLLNFSVYENPDTLSSDVPVTFGKIGCDGVELLTGYDEVPDAHAGMTAAVHLPYAADWRSVWEGEDVPECDPDTARFLMYGISREDIAENLKRAITVASSLNPPYGVLHAGSVKIHDILKRTNGDDRKVLDSFCEMVNTVISEFPGNRPPFKLAFENLWWPGLRLIDGWEIGYFEKNIEFDDWGICLDTGHLLNCLPDIHDEGDAVESLRKVFNGYGDGVKDRICTVHLHMSTSSDYRNSFEDRGPGNKSFDDFMIEANTHIGKIDQHRPFSTDGCKELVDILKPDYVTHELNGSFSEDPLEDFRQQRSHFGRN